VSCRRALADGPAAAAHPRLRDGAALPLPHRAGHAGAALGQARPPGARELALLARPLRPAVGARGVAAADSPARPAIHESLREPGMHVMQVSFFVDRARRPPEALLEAWHSLGDVAAAAASAGLRVTVVQASLVPAVIM